MITKPLSLNSPSVASAKDEMVIPFPLSHLTSFPFSPIFPPLLSSPLPSFLLFIPPPFPYSFCSSLSSVFHCSFLPSLHSFLFLPLLTSLLPPSHQATGPFLHIGALAAVTALSWVVAGQVARAEKTSESAFRFFIYFFISKS